MKLVCLTNLVFGLNAAIDTGKHQTISINEVEGHIEKGDLIPWLREKLGKDIDLSLLDHTMVTEITSGLNDILGGYRGRERRKWGVERSGLCLLLAWTNELIQQGKWTE